MLKYKIILSADDLHAIKWYVDDFFAVHAGFKSHRKKMNTERSIENEFVGADYISTMIL